MYPSHASCTPFPLSVVDSTGLTNTCGPCAAGLKGNAGPDNTACVDDIAPVITGCPTRKVVYTEDGQYTVAVQFDEPKYTENYWATVTFDPPSGSELPLGETTVVVNVTDVAGLSDSCTFVVSSIVIVPPQSLWHFHVPEPRITLPSQHNLSHHPFSTIQVEIDAPGNLVALPLLSLPADSPLLSLPDQTYYDSMLAGAFVVAIISSTRNGAADVPHAAFFLNKVRVVACSLSSRASELPILVTNVPRLLSLLLIGASNLLAGHLSRVFQAPLQTSDIGMSVVYYQSSVVIRVADGTSPLYTRRLQHAPVPLNNDVKRVLEVRPDGTDQRRLRLTVNDRLVFSPSIDVPGDLYTGGGISYGLADGTRVSARLSAFSIREMQPCEFTPCGDRATCVSDARRRDYSCACRPGYIGQADKDGKGCTPLTQSCKTCADLGWGRGYGSELVCGRSEGPNGLCPTPATYDAAASFCTQQGARLCTLAEVQMGTAARTGCGFDAERTWTLDTCDGGSSALTLGGNLIDRGDEHPLKCVEKTSTLAFRCCADVARLVSQRSCAELGVGWLSTIF
jgi:hypothetical protein